MNFKSFAAIVGFTVTATLSFIGGASAYTTHSNISVRNLDVQVAAITPLAMQYFCAQNRRECAGGGSAQVTMSPNLMAVLQQTNVRVNAAITPRRDGADVWSLNPSSGDCEDYVLSKRSALIRKGIPAGSLRIAYTHTRRGEPHAVLVVRTSQGDYVLDNLNNTVKTLRSSGYRIRSMSSSDPTRWTAG